MLPRMCSTCSMLMRVFQAWLKERGEYHYGTSSKGSNHVQHLKCNILYLLKLHNRAKLVKSLNETVDKEGGNQNAFEMHI